MLRGTVVGHFGAVTQTTPMAAVSATAAPRAVAPTTWAHAVACAWSAAWFDVRGREWLSSREVIADDFWRSDVTYQDGYGRRQNQRHRPDLATFIGDARRGVAVEVELQRKSNARLRGILAMYAARTTPPDASLAGVVYITGPVNVMKAVRAAAQASGLAEHPDDPNGKLRVLELATVIAETRQVAAQTRASLRSPVVADVA